MIDRSQSKSGPAHGAFTATATAATNAPPTATVGPATRSHPRDQATAARAALPHVRNGHRVLDVVAGSGWSTLLLAAQCGSNGHVWAWEVDPDQRALLRQNARAAGLEDRLTLIPEPGENDTLPPVDLVHLGIDADAVEWLQRHQGWLRHRGANVVLTLRSERSRRTAALSALAHADLLPFRMDGSPIQSPAQLEDLGPVDVPVVARSASRLAGVRVRVLEGRDALLQHFGLSQPGRLLEDDLDVVHNECERFDRKRHDAEVLCALAASFPGPCLDLGTSHGRSAFKLATNIGTDHRVTTVNVLPSDCGQAGVQITHLLTREQIGSYYRKAGIENVDQVFANTLTWDWPAPADCGYHVVFVDACHDTDAVYCDSLRAWERLAPGGFLVWHDFSPGLRRAYGWIDAVHRGVEAFARSTRLKQPVAWLQGSWCGVIQKDAPGRDGSVREAAPEDPTQKDRT